ncbi:MAG: hypothetical protein JF616_08545 [Fibrobacteres bacterium]|nr:hypothetical protein [Fibrobacterota bacterium]
MAESEGMPGELDGAEGTAEATAAPDPSPAERLAQALAAASLPAWRKAYLANLIASGQRFAESGNARGAGYCFDKVEEALRGLSAAAAPGGPSASSSQTPPRPSGPPPRSSDGMRSRWREDRLGHAEKVLRTHGARLSPLEKQSYRERLDKLRQEAGQPSQAGKSDAGLLDLRRRLYQRVLKAQKISLVLKRAPAAARPSPRLRPSATAAAWQPVTGPYNDQSNLEELLSVIGGADPAWVEEFLELYGGLINLNALLNPAASRQ